jgi:hypothetical protein
MKELSPTTIAVFARENLKIIRAEEYVEWAIHMLEQGFESYNLCMLAGLVPLLNMFEVQSHFRKSIDELGIVRKSQSEEINDYAIILISGLVDKSISPDTALPILNKLCVASDYEEYFIFYELDDARLDVNSGHYPHMYPDAYDNDFIEVVSKEAKAYLKKQKK